MPRQEYLQYIDLLTEQEEMKDTVVASLIAAGWVMGMAREEDPINRDQITSTDQILSEGMELCVTYFTSPIDVVVTKESMKKEPIMEQY